MLLGWRLRGKAGAGCTREKCLCGEDCMKKKQQKEHHCRLLRVIDPRFQRVKCRARTVLLTPAKDKYKDLKT